MSDQMTTLADDVTGYATRAGSRLAAALARVADEAPEQRAAARARDTAESLVEQAAARARYRRKRYEEARPAVYADAAYGLLAAQQDPDGKGSRWLASNHKNALLVGPSGHGKSYLAYAIGNDAITRGMWVEAWSVTELFQALAPLPTHARADEVRSQRQENIAGWVRDCELLILDDLGVEQSSGYVADRNIEQLTDILNHRDGDPRFRTIITANGDKTHHLVTEAERRAVQAAAVASLAARYGERVATRLQNDMVGVWIEGDCFRKAATWNPF